MGIDVTKDAKEIELVEVQKCLEVSEFVLLIWFYRLFPLFYHSFLKLPKCVLKKMVRLQNDFLRGGDLERKKILWVKWDKVCLPKSMGG